MAVKKIHVLGSGRYDEIVAAGAITPGHLVEQDSDNAVVVHNSEGARHERLFAIEDALQGNTIDDAYASTDLVALVFANVGDFVRAWLKAGETATIGEELMSAGDGTLMCVDNITSGVTLQHIVGIAQEALDLSASGAVATRITVRIV